MRASLFWRCHLKTSCSETASVNNSEFDHFSKNTKYNATNPPAAMKVQNPSQLHQSLSDRIDQFFAEVSNKVCTILYEDHFIEPSPTFQEEELRQEQEEKQMRIEARRRYTAQRSISYQVKQKIRYP